MPGEGDNKEKARAAPTRSTSSLRTLPHSAAVAAEQAKRIEINKWAPEAACGGGGDDDDEQMKKLWCTRSERKKEKKGKRLRERRHNAIPDVESTSSRAAGRRQRV